MKYSSNYNLYLPEGSDYVTPEQYNANFETIDGKLKTIEAGAASKTHTHGPGDLTGVLPVQKGGTGQSSASAALAALITGSGALNATGLSANDVIGVADVSVSGGGKKVTVGDLFNFLGNNFWAGRMVFGSWNGTGKWGITNPNTLTLPFAAKLIWILGESDTRYSYGFVPFRRYEDPSLILVPYIGTSFNTDYDHYSLNLNGYSCRTKKSADGKTIQWYNPSTGNYSASVQGNESGVIYYYIAFG